VPERRSGAAVTGPHPLEIPADLPVAQVDAVPRQGAAELAAGPGPPPAEQLAQGLGDAAVPPGVGGRPAAERVQGRDPAREERAEQVADGLGMVAEAFGDPRRGPAGIGEGDHLDAVADLGRQGGSSQGPEFVPGCVVERDADHAEL
jgi:hypothetical protein